MAWVTDRVRVGDLSEDLGHDYRRALSVFVFFLGCHVHLNSLGEARIRQHIALHDYKVFLELHLAVVDLSQCRRHTVGLVKFERIDLQATQLVGVRRLYCLYYGAEHATVFRRYENDLADIVDGKELERIEEQGDVCQWEQALGSITAHWLELIVEALCKQDCLHRLSLVRLTV